MSGFVRRDGSSVFGGVFVDQVGEFLPGSLLERLAFGGKVLESLAEGFGHLIMRVLRSSKDRELLGLRNAFVAVRTIQTEAKEVGRRLGFPGSPVMILVSVGHR